MTDPATNILGLPYRDAQPLLIADTLTGGTLRYRNGGSKMNNPLFTKRDIIVQIDNMLIRGSE
jgi:hypothetical protein